MNKEKIKEWLDDISTPTGISYSGDSTLSDSEVEVIIDFIDELQQENKQLKENLNEILRFTKEISYKNLADRWCFTNKNYAQNIIDIIEKGGSNDNTN